MKALLLLTSRERSGRVEEGFAQPKCPTGCLTDRRPVDLLKVYLVEVKQLVTTTYYKSALSTSSMRGGGSETTSQWAG